MSATMSKYVPGRPVTGPGGRCPFCLDNGMFKGEILVETKHGFVGKIADDLVLICPKDHQTTGPWDTMFAVEYFELLRLTLEILGWKNYNDSCNYGHVAGQRLEHLHYKVQRRDEDQPASGWGLDALINMVNGTM